MNIRDKKPSHLRLVWSERIKRSSPEWQEKLGRIREQLWQGTYSVKSDDVAKAILRKEKSLFGAQQQIPLSWWRKKRTLPQFFWREKLGET